uniref:Translin-associated factor X-interacting protein 1 N-terminal domain-containing protein n=1 Tax=Melopsittacus undulatus TaxID=13146 RepID=A0A8C6IPB0_MELUD
MKSPSPASLEALFRYWKAAMRSPCSLLFCRLKRPNFLSLSSYGRCSSPLIILVPYREVFEFFIDSFKTYKPLLSTIRNEVTLAYQKKMICELESLKAMVATASEEYTLQILTLQEKQKEKIRILEQEKQHLLKIIGLIKEEKNFLHIQVECLQASVAEEYSCYLNKHSARKLLLEKLNYMNAHLDMRPHQEQGRESGSLEDPILHRDPDLTLVLKVVRQDLTKVHAMLNQVKASYGDYFVTVHLSVFFRQKLQKNFDQLHKEYEPLLEIQRETAEEQDNFHAELPQVEHNSTPWPKWQSVQVPNELSSGLLKGKGDNVSVKLTKKDMVNILKDVWKEKIALEQQLWKRSRLPEFFLSYLQKQYGDAAAMKWFYTLFENMWLSVFITCVCKKQRDTSRSRDNNTKSYLCSAFQATWILTVAPVSKCSFHLPQEVKADDLKTMSQPKKLCLWKLSFRD